MAGNKRVRVNANRLPSKVARVDTGCTSPEVGTSIEERRLLVVANRLPFEAVRQGGTWRLKRSVGGLVSGLSGIHDFKTTWIGWPGVDVHDQAGKESLKRELEKEGCIPVFLTQEQIDSYYTGFSNGILWPLLHNNKIPEANDAQTYNKHKSWFASYKLVNQIFAGVVSKNYQEGVMVWVHDYHLMFLPECLKRHCRDMKVGWFLHTAFPPRQTFEMLPSSSELLRGIVGADLIGLHTREYMDNFTSTCTRLLDFEIGPGGMKDKQGKLIRVGDFPIGIDPRRFIAAQKSEEVERIVEEIKEFTGGRKIILGIDRLDPIKGIPNKLFAFEKFMEENPKLRKKVIMIQVAVPSRSNVTEYQRLESQVYEMSGRIASKFTRLSYNPIYIWNTSVSFEDMVALYKVADVALITSLSDGMNLVCNEFVASQGSNKGVLILSKFAGAAEFLTGALLVNPLDTDEVIENIKEALKMSKKERKNKHAENFKHVIHNTAEDWGRLFIGALLEDQ